MAKNPKFTGRAMLTASMPTDLDDPRLMDVADIVKAVDQMEVVTDNSSPTLEALAPAIWAKHNAKPGQRAEAAARSRPAKQPQSIEDLHDSAWSKFRNPPRGQTQGER